MAPNYAPINMRHVYSFSSGPFYLFIDPLFRLLSACSTIPLPLCTFLYLLICGAYSIFIPFHSYQLRSFTTFFFCSFHRFRLEWNIHSHRFPFSSVFGEPKTEARPFVTFLLLCYTHYELYSLCSSN